MKDQEKADYKKQINELQCALVIERHKNNAMAKGLIPKEYVDQQNAKLREGFYRMASNFKECVPGIDISEYEIRAGLKEKE